MFKKIILSTVFILGSTAIFAQTQELPTTTVRDINGKQISFNEAFEKGKVTLVSFWATWCIPCKQEIKNIIFSEIIQTSKNYLRVCTSYE